MPLAEKEGWEDSNSRYCGVETDFSDDVPSLLSFHIDNGPFDFVVAPLMKPSYRPTESDPHPLPFAGSASDVPPSQWRDRVVGRISSWINLDSFAESIRIESETALKQEIARANHLSLQACLLPTPTSCSCLNYARVVKQILQEKSQMELWLRIPIRKPESILSSETPKDTWNIWNEFRLFCGHHTKLFVVLDIGSSYVPVGRWFGEPVKAAILSTECFLSNPDGHPYLLPCHQELIKRFFNHSIQVIISGRSLHNLQQDSINITQGMQTHPYKLLLDCVSSVFNGMKLHSEQERVWLSVRDCLHAPSQPLKDNLDANRYEMLERDSVKYDQYRKAIAKALTDRVPNDKASELTTVLMVVGAGRGPLVKASLQAAEETGRKLKIYAVEKNPNAVITLNDLIKTSGVEGTVTVVSCDIRFWNAPERVDILVSELLGSFGDNDLSPECLDAAQRFLKRKGISIPCSYTSFLQPITAAKLYSDLKRDNDPSCYETAYSVKLHSVARLAPCLPVFTFKHPNLSRKPNNQCYKMLSFDLQFGRGSALVHGFAGYFEATLYDDVHISTKPGTATPNMLGWLPMFFPLREPVEVYSFLDAHIWRCSDPKKVWYEWAVSMPTITPFHNTNGSSYSMSL